jgi:hypothetical protein
MTIYGRLGQWLTCALVLLAIVARLGLWWLDRRHGARQRELQLERFRQHQEP